MTQCSVVIPTFRRAALLERCITALVTQTMSPERYEIVVADDGADDATRAHVEAMTRSARVAIHYVPVIGDKHGPAAARNAGWRSARHSTIVAFTDDDTMPAPDWLERALVPFANPHVHAVWGRIVVPLPPNPTDYERDAAGLETAGFVTANCLVRRRVLETIGGFDEQFELAWREDSDLYFRLIDGGYRVEHAPDAVVVHPVRPATWGVSLQQQRKAAFDALLYKKHPTSYKQFVRPGRPRAYYAIVVALAAMILGAVVRSRPLATVGAICWLALTGAFALRRLRGTSRAPRHVAEMLVTSMLIPPLSLYWRVRGGVRHRVFFW
jgi:cellulose synthase/poly-beta-1,6-N-acetylglucosamine synthase-like glycosyltransferase